jgi:4a-hydroxytetrahydrobiopterin dehydratase
MPRGCTTTQGRAIEEASRQHSRVGGGERTPPAREFRFPDFKQALEFVNRVGAIAEQEGHHPDILLAWGKVGITLWTHTIDGLTESDFILAAKIDRFAK